jgi:hypothetical protein
LEGVVLFGIEDDGENGYFEWIVDSYLGDYWEYLYFYVGGSCANGATSATGVDLTD